MSAVLRVPNPVSTAVSPANLLEHDKGTLRVSGGRKAYGSWQ